MGSYASGLLVYGQEVVPVWDDRTGEQRDWLYPWEIQNEDGDTEDPEDFDFSEWVKSYVDEESPLLWEFHGYEWDLGLLVVRGAVFEADWGEAAEISPDRLVELSDPYCNPYGHAAAALCRDLDIPWNPRWLLVARYG